MQNVENPEKKKERLWDIKKERKNGERKRARRELYFYTWSEKKAEISATWEEKKKENKK